MGYFLSNGIVNLSELIIFWMLYIITLSTIFTILLSVYINYDIRNLKGPRGDEGEKGEKGEYGEPGQCERDCKLHIPYNVILFNIEKYLYELENNGKDNKTENSLERDKVNELLKKKGSKDVYDDTHLNSVLIACKKIFAHINEIDDTNERLELKNMYLKETIKRIVYSNQFKELEKKRVDTKTGKYKLTTYISYVFLIWVKEIYDKSSIKYFTTTGAEDDFKFYDKNPFDEIKKYDIFYWGMSTKGKPRNISSKPLYKKKVEFKKEGFHNHKPLENINVSTDVENPEQRVDIGSENGPIIPKKEIKIIRSNDYILSYTDKGSKLDDSIACFKVKPTNSSLHGKSETYYPIGDICVNRFGDKSINVKKKKNFW